MNKELDPMMGKKRMKELKGREGGEMKIKDECNVGGRMEIWNER